MSTRDKRDTFYSEASLLLYLPMLILKCDFQTLSIGFRYLLDIHFEK